MVFDIKPQREREKEGAALCANNATTGDAADDVGLKIDGSSLPPSLKFGSMGGPFDS